MKNNYVGFTMGTICVLAFSLTLPLTKYLVTYQTPLEVGLSRALIAAVFALFILLIFSKKLPAKNQLKKLIVVSITIVIGFPVLTAFSMDHLSSGYGAVILACLPIMTAVFGAILGNERPSLYFWILSCIGVLLVIGYSLLNTSPEQFGLGDIMLFIASACAGLGYAQGGLLAKELPGWEVICWALLLSFPALLIFLVFNFNPENFSSLDYPQWLAILYLGLINSLFGFFIWYKALALGGVVKVSQTQLLQPFFTYFFSIIIFGENFSIEAMLLFLFLTVIIVKIKNT